MEAKIQTPPQQEDIFSIVERVVRIVSNVRGAKSDYAHLASELAPFIPFDLFGVVLLRHDRRAVRVIVSTREAGQWVSRYHQHPLSDSMFEHILRASISAEPGAPPVIPDAPDAEHAGDEPGMLKRAYPDGLDGTPSECGDALSGHPHLRATLVAPLLVGDRVLGSLELGSADIGAYDNEYLLRLIPAIARVLAAAIENAQVGGNLEIQDRQREELRKVSSALASKMDLAAILEHIVEGIAKALNVASAIVMLDRQTRGLHLHAQHGLHAETLQRLVSLKLMLTDTTIIGYTLRRRQPTVSDDIAVDQRFPGSQVFALELGMRSVFSYPLVVGSTVFGALLLFSPEPGGFTPLKSDILSLFASQAMVAIHNGMLLEAVQERQRFQDAIDQLEQAHQRDLTVEHEQALLKTVRQETERSFGVSFTSLLRFISNHLLTRSERDLQSILQDIEQEYQAQQVLASGAAFEADDARTTSPHQQDNAPSLAQSPQAINGPVALLSAANEGGATLLRRKIDIALASTGLLGDVGAAFTAMLDTAGMARGISTVPGLHERITHSVQDGWIIVDLAGHCMYANAAAESLCGMRLELDPFGNVALGTAFLAFHGEPTLQYGQGLSLPEALVRLLPRIRNLEEVEAYLQEFVYTTMSEERNAERLQRMGEDQDTMPHLHPFPTNTLRCVIAAEPLQGNTHALEAAIGAGLFPSSAPASSVRPTNLPAMLLDNAPSDRHYQLARYALYDQDGELIAQALQIHDVTEQARDEKNKSALLSSFSHDLRTPLTAIKVAVSGLLEPDIEWDEKTRREMLEDIDAEADHLHQLINSMFEMSRIEMGALALEKEWGDLAEIVHSSLLHIEHAFPGRRIRTEFQPALPLVQIDYVQMQRVFYNLLENAARHSSKKDEILITADTLASSTPGESEPQATSRLRVRVIDHGSGVPEEERERIFKSFYSLDGHTGLGLAICRGIIEAHHGRIWVESAPGGGACFVFVLPISS